MTVQLKKPSAAAIAIHLVDRASFGKVAAKLPAATRRWLADRGLRGAPDSHALLADANGRLQAVWAGVRDVRHPFALAALPRALPPGRYRLGDQGLAVDDEAAALSWELGSYVFDLYKPRRARSGRADAGAQRRRHARAAAGRRDRCHARPGQHAGRTHGPGRTGRGGAPVAEQHGAKFKQTRRRRTARRPASRRSTRSAARRRARRA